MTSETQATIALVDAGVRGRLAYGDYCLRHPDRVQAVAVAEPDAERRERFAREHAIPASRRFAGWAELLASDRLADAVIVAAPDRVHAEPAIRALELGYDVLLEKPIAVTPKELDRLLAGARASEGRLVVAHPLRRAPLFHAVARLVGGGCIGRVVTIDHVENVGYLHFAHSYVRRNWRRTDLAAPMILAKACHDLDLLAWLVGSPWSRGVVRLARALSTAERPCGGARPMHRWLPGAVDLPVRLGRLRPAAHDPAGVGQRSDP